MTTPLKIAGRTFTWGTRTYLMGILNITPDSFSGDGLIADAGSGEWQESEMVQASLEQARRFVEAGVDILDVGGESTRPGSQSLDAEEEIRRVIPIVQALSAELDVLISVDTYKAQIAEAALNAGAHMVNDVWGLKADPDLAGIVAGYQTPVILMHNRSSWANAEIKESLGGRYIGMAYEDLLGDIRLELEQSVALAHAAGIPDEHIILDPGIGFGKTVEQNLELLDRLGEIKALGYPVLLGTSRKSFIGYTLDKPVDRRLEGTAASVAVGIVRGADIIRVHDVHFMAQVVRMTDAIVRRS
jgi:dihydropteroate synthase